MAPAHSRIRNSDDQIETRFRQVKLESSPRQYTAPLSYEMPTTPIERSMPPGLFRPLSLDYSTPSTPAWSSPRTLDTPYSTYSTMSPQTPFTPFTPITPSNPDFALPLDSPDFRYDGYSLDRLPSLKSYQDPHNHNYVAAGSYKHELARELAKSKAVDGRYLMIHGLPLDTSPAEVKELFTGLAELKAIIVKFLASHGFIFLVFFDPRQAHIIQDTLRDHPIEFSASPNGGSMLMVTDSSRSSIEDIVGNEESMKRVWHEAEAHVVLRVIAYKGAANAKHLDLQTALAIIGDVRSFRVISYESETFLAEFFDTRHAALAITTLDGAISDGCRILAAYLSETQDSMHLKQMFASEVPRASALPSPRDLPLAIPLEENAVGKTQSQTRDEQESTYVPPARRSVEIFSANAKAKSDDSVKPLTNKRPPSLQNQLQKQREKLGLRRQPAGEAANASRPISRPTATPVDLHIEQKPTIVRRSTSASDLTSILSGASRHAWQDTIPERQRIPVPNIVDKARVRSGVDTRTTVMIKDVPNKLSRHQLVDILNEVVPGGFDFVYLRFDFKNRCNVGYAFVNFCSTDALYKFMDAKCGRKWNLFQSEKILQVSYADIQGKEALIAKFRNSSVMDVNEAWRPQIFHSSGPKKGTEESFPESDDPRMRYRSTAARLIGLYIDPVETKPATSLPVTPPPRSRRAKW